MKKIVFCILICVAFTVLGCGSMLYQPTSANTAEQARLVAGRTTYIQKCNSCHNLFRPERFAQSVWRKNLDEMKERAKITSEESDLIFAYVSWRPPTASHE